MSSSEEELRVPEDAPGSAQQPREVAPDNDDDSTSRGPEADADTVTSPDQDHGDAVVASTGVVECSDADEPLLDQVAAEDACSAGVAAQKDAIGDGDTGAAQDSAGVDDAPDESDVDFTTEEHLLASAVASTPQSASEQYRAAGLPLTHPHASAAAIAAHED